MLTQYLIDGLFDGKPSDQFIETVEQVNFRLRLKQITDAEASDLVTQAAITENYSRYYGFPLEDGSPQTVENELTRTRLCRQAKK